MLKIRDLKLDIPFFQASLSGYTDRPMRILAREFGAPLTFTGVMLDKIALHRKAVEKIVFQPDPAEHPVGAQILGTEPQTMAASAKVFHQRGYDLIDLNFACPAPKVLRRQRGGYMLTKPYAIMEIYNRVRDTVTCPVLMKLRAGYDSTEACQEDFWQLCEYANDHQVDALVIHGRTVMQKYRKTANWGILAEIKKRFPQLTIIGSGDIFDPHTAINRLQSSGLDGLIIARGAIGNPWIFTELRRLYNNQPMPNPPSLKEQGQIMLRHFEMILQERSSIKAVRYFRKFAVGYCKRHPERKKVQLAIITARDKNQLTTAIKQAYQLA